MLDAIAATTLLDDDFRQDPTTLGLESRVAQLTGKQAGLFVVSGTMGNLVSIRTHLQAPPHSVLCDHRSHIVTHEAGGIASLCGAMGHPRDGLPDAAGVAGVSAGRRGDAARRVPPHQRVGARARRAAAPGWGAAVGGGGRRGGIAARLLRVL
ncbi:alanine racemase, partial [Metarhizium brunneum ARSEF 3297]